MACLHQLQLRRDAKTKTPKTWQHLFGHLDQRIRTNEDIPAVLGDERRMSMNFKPITNDKCGTVEFRRPPDVRTAPEAQRWAAFALALVSAFLEPAWDDATAHEWSAKRSNATVAQLHTFLHHGLAHLDKATGDIH